MVRARLNGLGLTPDVLRPALVASAAVALVAAVALTLVARATSTTSQASAPSSAPSSTSRTRPPSPEVSLVTPGSTGPVFRWHDQVVDAEELRKATDPDAVPVSFPVTIDDRLVSAQRSAGVALGRLEAQVQIVANRLGPALAVADPASSVAPGRPAPRGDGLGVPILVVNPTSEPLSVDALDLRILARDGTPTTARTRFFEGDKITIAPGSGFFGLVTFPAPQVIAPAPSGADYRFDAELRWSPAPA